MWRPELMEVTCNVVNLKGKPGKDTFVLAKQNFTEDQFRTYISKFPSCK